MKLKKFCEWLGKESVNLEINPKYQGVEGFLFLRWVNAFRRHLNKTEKEQLDMRLPNIQSNIESMYDRLEWKEIKKAIKEVRANGNGG